MPGPHGFGAYKPLVFKTTCDLCRAAIQPHDRRLHCYTCTSALVSPASAGDYDICTTCYRELEESGRISRENGRDGWRRCPQGHRMSVIAFAENKYGQWRNVVQEVVGGFRLYREEVVSEQQGLMGVGAGMEQWCWAEEDGEYVRTMVTKDVATATGRGPGALPPDGGKGPRAVALWAYYPKKEAADELMFPKGAEISEITFDNESWAFGVYMGKKGLFPIAYVRAP